MQAAASVVVSHQLPVSMWITISHHITSRGENGSRPQRPLYPKNNTKIYTFIRHEDRI